MRGGVRPLFTMCVEVWNFPKFAGLGPTGLRPFLFAVNIPSWGRVSSGPHLQAWPFFSPLCTNLTEGVFAEVVRYPQATFVQRHRAVHGRGATLSGCDLGG